MEPSGDKHIRRIHFFVQSASGLFQKNEKPHSCSVVFGLNGSFYQTTQKSGVCPEWNEVQQFDVTSDLLALHVCIRDGRRRLATAQVPVSSIVFSSTEPQQLQLKHKIHSELAPILFYRSDILNYRSAFGNKACDWVSERLPLITESLRNVQVIEWSWPNCRQPPPTYRKDSERNAENTVNNHETITTNSPFISSIKGAIAVSTLFNNPNFLDREQVEINSAIPRRATVSGGTRIIIGGNSFGVDISNVKLLLIAGSDCTKMIQSHSANQIHVLTRRFYPVSAEIVIVTKSNGTAISDFEFTFYDESSTYRKMSCVPAMPPPKQYRSTCSQTTPQIGKEQTMQAERIGRLEDEVDELRLENKRQGLYLDHLSIG